MKTIHRTKIRFEKRELKFVRPSGGGGPKLFCRDCRTETFHWPVARAAAVLGASEMTVFQWAETGRIHSTETAEGRLWICADSATDLDQ